MKHKSKALSMLLSLALLLGLIPAGATGARAVTIVEPEPVDGDGDSTGTYDYDIDDVSEDDYYYDAVLWALANEITNGTGENTFSPGNGCTRAQVVTFLHRAAGEPEPKSLDCPFIDVPPGSWYFKAVLWAVEQGITNGTG
ncbi:MAG: S-layer homology domain-containing protein, partial [Oscillospiraceae bacterium]|nr:S-layer homology domain-containing protein [Oscillospiraceae bacterium]